MAKFYANENFALQAVLELRQLGHDVLTIQEAGAGNQALPDEDVLAFAVSADRCVLTLNRKHFIRLHKHRPDHRGIVVCSFDTDFSAMARRIHEEMAKFPDLSGRFVRVSQPPS